MPKNLSVIRDFRSGALQEKVTFPTQFFVKCARQQAANPHLLQTSATDAIASQGRQSKHLRLEPWEQYHNGRTVCTTTEAEYIAQIKVYTRQMQEPYAQRNELQSAPNKYSVVQNWLVNFKEATETDDIYVPDNAAIIKATVEYIVVHSDSLEIHLKCRVTMKRNFQQS